MKYTFNSENEKKGALILITNALVATPSIKQYSILDEGLTVTFEGVPDAIFTAVEAHRHWPVIEEVGKFYSLEEYLGTVPQRFDEAKDIEGEISNIKNELGLLIK